MPTVKELEALFTSINKECNERIAKERKKHREESLQISNLLHKKHRYVAKEIRNILQDSR